MERWRERRVVIHDGVVTSAQLLPSLRTLGQDCQPQLSSYASTLKKRNSIQF